MRSRSIPLALTRIGAWRLALDAASIEEILGASAAESSDVLDLAALLGVSSEESSRKIVRLESAGALRLVRIGTDLVVREVPVEHLYTLPSFLVELVPPSVTGLVYEADLGSTSFLIDSHRLEPRACSTRSG